MPEPLLEIIKGKYEKEVKEKFNELEHNNKTVKWSDHCILELDADGLTTDDIKNAIDSAELIEFFWTYYYKSPKLIFHLDVPSKPPAHIVVLYNEEYVYVKTAYLATDRQKFEPDGRTRVRNFER